VTDTETYKKRIDAVMKKPKAVFDPVIKELNAQYGKAESAYNAQVAQLEEQKRKLVTPEGEGEDEEIEKQKAAVASQQAVIDMQIKAIEKPAASSVVKAYNTLNKAIGRFEKTKKKPATSKK
jgi:hypothetical protein